MSLHEELLDLETAVYQVSKGINAVEAMTHPHPGEEARQRRLPHPPLRGGARGGLCHLGGHRPGPAHRPPAEPQRRPDPH